MATEAARAGHGPLQFLAAPLEGEVHQREANVERARIRAAHFPELKELSSFEFSLVPSLNAALVTDLARGSWIQHREVVLAVEARRQGKRVRFVTVAELVTDLAEAQAQHRLSRLEEQLDRLDLLICDELGFVSLDADHAQLLFILLAHRYTRGALAITSNLEFADWPKVFNGDSRLVAALLDRLTHRCHLLEFQGDSYRFRQSRTARRGTSRAASDLSGAAAGPDGSRSLPTGRPTSPGKPRP
ncbi:MAG TPA: ATP-binding protein [Candidatus Nanopelagicaceae bacterium]|nr:ATP-binding protein [Candidatus Nanopelagicaceae bacterium]